MQKYKKRAVMLVILIEAFPEWKKNKGIFEYFPDPPWKDVISSVELNLEYFGNISGSKGISPLVSKMLTDGILEDSSRQALALLISSKFKVNWTRLWNAEVAVYDPVHNYDMHEEGTRTGNNRNESQSTDETQHGRSNTSRYSHYGFNSQTSNPSDEDVTTEGGTTNLNRNGSVDYTINEGTTLHRYGNIGVTTNQQMIEAERSIRMWNYFNSVYKDIDSVLAIRIYDPCSVKITHSISNPIPSKPEYSLPIASAETLGGVKIGSGVNVTDEGTISVTEPTPYTLPPATSETLGGVKIGSGVNVTGDGTISVNAGGITVETFQSNSCPKQLTDDGLLVIINHGDSTEGEVTVTTPSWGDYTYTMARRNIFVIPIKAGSSVGIINDGGKRNTFFYYH